MSRSALRVRSWANERLESQWGDDDGGNLREDEEFRRTGVIQSERQAFEMAREHFGLDERNGAV